MNRLYDVTKWTPCELYMVDYIDVMNKIPKFEENFHITIFFSGILIYLEKPNFDQIEIWGAPLPLGLFMGHALK